MCILCAFGWYLSYCFIFAVLVEYPAATPSMYKRVTTIVPILKASVSLFNTQKLKHKEKYYVEVKNIFRGTVVQKAVLIAYIGANTFFYSSVTFITLLII